MGIQPPPQMKQGEPIKGEGEREGEDDEDEEGGDGGEQADDAVADTTATLLLGVRMTPLPLAIVGE
jgi:hypothetical protein